MHAYVSTSDLLWPKGSEDRTHAINLEESLTSFSGNKTYEAILDLSAAKTIIKWILIIAGHLENWNG